METVNVKFEKVPIRPGPRKLTSKWLVEIEQDVEVMYAAPETRWERFCNWVKSFFDKK